MGKGGPMGRTLCEGHSRDAGLRVDRGWLRLVQVPWGPLRLPPQPSPPPSCPCPTPFPSPPFQSPGRGLELSTKPPPAHGVVIVLPTMSVLNKQMFIVNP